MIRTFLYPGITDAIPPPGGGVPPSAGASGSKGSVRAFLYPSLFEPLPVPVSAASMAGFLAPLEQPLFARTGIGSVQFAASPYDIPAATAALEWLVRADGAPGDKAPQRRASTA